MEPIIQLTREPLDRNALVEAVTHASVGGIVIFEGVVRDNARGKQVRYLEYDAYIEMAKEQIRAIVDEAERRWGVEHVAVAHRFGRLEIGEASVIIVVAAPHRAEAFEACLPSPSRPRCACARPAPALEDIRALRISIPT